MSTFLNCKGEAYFQLKLVLRYQEREGLKVQEVFVNSKNDYKITVADNEYGVCTYNCKIVGFTLANKPDPRSLVNYDKEGNSAGYCEVDTIKIDCSEAGSSMVKTINICDIRFIEEFTTEGFEYITNHVENFR